MLAPGKGHQNRLKCQIPRGMSGTPTLTGALLHVLSLDFYYFTLSLVTR